MKVGVIGVGSISGHHIEAYKNHPDVELFALCDINKSRLEEKGKKYKVDHLYTDYQELLANEDIDAVSICTWNNVHAEITIAAIEAGKHVLVEKPLSSTLASAQKIAEVAQQTDKIVSVGMVRRYAENAEILNDWIQKDKLGSIYYAKASLLRRLGHPGGWFGDKAISGGGPLVDLGVHLLDISWYMMGKPKIVSVSANTSYLLGQRKNIGHLSYYQAADQTDKESDVEDFANALIRFENGSSLFLETSYTMHLPENELNIQFFGDKGGAILEPSLYLTTEEDGIILNAEPQIDALTFTNQAYVDEVNQFIACCQGQAENISPVEDGLAIMEVLDAIYRSADEKREIRL